MTNQNADTETAPEPTSVAPTEPEKRPGLLRRLYNWVLHWADTRYGTPALAGISFTESSFFPIPPDPLLIALAIGKRERSLWYAFVCTVSSVLGGLLGYWIGASLFDLFGTKIIEFYGAEKLFGDLQEDFKTWGFWAILGAALTPMPYKVFTIAAGACGLNLWTFTIASVVGRGARFFTVALLIRIFGEKIRDFIERRFDLVAILFMIALVGGFVVVKLFFGGDH
ncbi:MAG: YqaA family protein [Planctomycetota bacterium]